MIINNVNHLKLLSEFDAHGVLYDKSNLYNDMEYVPNDSKKPKETCNLTINFASDVDMELVHSIIEAHSPTPYKAMPSETERISILEDTINFLLGL